MGKTIVTFYRLAAAVAAAAVMINVVVADAVDSPVAPAVSPTASVATTYINHTVGGAAGWFFNSATNHSSFDYTAWAAGQVFGLGDNLKDGGVKFHSIHINASLTTKEPLPRESSFRRDNDFPREDHSGTFTS